MCKCSFVCKPLVAFFKWKKELCYVLTTTCDVDNKRFMTLTCSVSRFSLLSFSGIVEAELLPGQKNKHVNLMQFTSAHTLPISLWVNRGGGGRAISFWLNWGGAGRQASLWVNRGGGRHTVEMITSVNISYVAGFVNLWWNGENLFSENEILFQKIILKVFSTWLYIIFTFWCNTIIISLLALWRQFL